MSPLKVGQVVTATVRTHADHGIFLSVAEDPNAFIEILIDEMAWADPTTVEFLHGIPRYTLFPPVGEQIDILLLQQDRHRWRASIKRLIKTLPTYNPQKYCVGSLHTAVVTYSSFSDNCKACYFVVQDGLKFYWEVPLGMDIDEILMGDSALIEITEDIYNLEEWFPGNTCRFIQRITSEERGFPIAWRPR